MTTWLKGDPVTISYLRKQSYFSIFTHDSLHTLQFTTTLAILHPFYLFWPLHKQHPISLSKERSVHHD